MKKSSQAYQLKDMSTLAIRSLEASDAPLLVSYMASIFAESPFLTLYSDEWKTTIEDEEKILEAAEMAGNRLMLGGFLNHDLVAPCDFAPVGPVYKIAHRCQIGISVKDTQHGKGIASFMMDNLLSAAKQSGFYQMELEVVSSNNTAIKLYEKFGFRRIGTIPHGFRYREGYHEDLLLMVKRL